MRRATRPRPPWETGGGGLPQPRLPCLRDRALSNAERPDALLHQHRVLPRRHLGEVSEDAISAPGLDVALAKGEGSPPRAGRNEGGRRMLRGCCDS